MRIRSLCVLVLVGGMLALGLGACGGIGEETPVSLPSATATILPTTMEPTTVAQVTAPPPTEPPPTKEPSTAAPASPTSSAGPTASPATTASLAPTATPLPTPPATTPPIATSAPPTSPALPTSPAPLADPATVKVVLEKVVEGLETPVAIAQAGDGSGRLFLVEKVGRIRVVQDGALLPTPFLDIGDRVGSSENEQGLLGLAFHPQFGENGYFYVNYTNHQGDTVVSRFAAGAGPGQADPGSEVLLLTVDQPAGNHNGGHLAFGPDGYLYIGTGDGGGSGDRYGNGQNGRTLLGAMLRLDVDHAQPYGIPGDNPFVGNPDVQNEIWALGLRNPWRYSFDRLTGDLYIADVGQNQYEEVNVQPAGSPGGQNYGWPIMEGVHCFRSNQSCDTTGLSLPVGEYEHSQGCSVTGGTVYRGQAYPELMGIYFYGDWCSGRIWGLAPAGGDVGGNDWRVAVVGLTDLHISAFGEDEAGELYLLAMGRGELYRLVSE